MFNQNKAEGVRAFIYEYMPDFPEPYDKAEKEIYIPSVKVIVNATDVFFSDHPRNVSKRIWYAFSEQPKDHEAPLSGISLTTEYVNQLVKIAAAKEIYWKAETDFRQQLKNLQEHSAFHHEQFHTNHYADLKP